MDHMCSMRTTGSGQLVSERLGLVSLPTRPVNGHQCATYSMQHEGTWKRQRSSGSGAQVLWIQGRE